MARPTPAPPARGRRSRASAQPVVVGPSHADTCTRQRLIEEAGEVFAQEGFRHATVREICRRAGANVAAVNYHFGSKEGLYAAVVEYAKCCADDPKPDLEQARDPAQRLRLFVTHFMRRILDEGRPAWHGQIMLREMADPTPALDQIVRKAVRPQWDLLVEIISELAPGAPRGDVERAAASVIGQCVLYRNCSPIVERLVPASSRKIDAIASHIAEFSLAGVRGVLGSARGAHR